MSAKADGDYSARQKLVTAGQDSVKDILYQYITGQEFTMRIRAVVGAFQRMNGKYGSPPARG